MIRTNDECSDLYFSLGSKLYSLKKWLKSFIYIVDETSATHTLELNEAQDQLLFEICKCVKNKKPIRFVILKARQLGFTTFIAALIFVLTMFQSNRKAVIIAHKTESTGEIFKMYKRFYDNLPEALKTKLSADNRREIQSQSTGSSIRVLTQGDGVGRGATINYVHLSEAGFYDDLDGTLTAILQSVYMGNLENMVFIESTANGFNSFKDYYDLGVSKQGIWKSFFYPWFMKKGNELPYDGFTKTPYEEKLQKDYHLSDEQMAWWRVKWVELKKDLNLMKQENPTIPMDAFISTGNSVFDNEAIAIRKQYVSENVHYFQGDFYFDINGSFTDYKIENVEFRKTKVGNLKVYERPIEGHPYVIGIDPARGKGIDYTVFQVIDNSTLKQVATYMVKGEDNDISAAKAILLAQKYNDALLVPETNTTDAMVKFFMKANYNHVYIREAQDSSFSGALYELYGVKTGYNKKTMVDIAVGICREKTYTNIYDFETLTQMESFVYEESSNSERVKAKGSGKSHDDCVMALLIAYYGREQQRADVEDNLHKMLVRKIGFDPLDLDKDYEDENKIEDIYTWAD